jgi:tubulin---tyrosine ligase
VNDDGPPNISSPYIAPFVKALQRAGHQTSVILPATNNSGVGKAYNFGQVVQPVTYSPALAEADGGAPDTWLLVNATPASCVQLGIYHLFQDRGQVDLVISGPNYGHNLTSVYNLASGTVGGAMEAALCGKKAISLSFAFGNHQIPGEDGVHSAEVINLASQISIQLIENLVREWHDGVEVYHINVPSLPTAGVPEVVWTTATRSSLGSPSIFAPMDEKDTALSTANSLPAFKWAPNFTDVKRSLEEGHPGTDAWALKEGYIGFVSPACRIKYVITKSSFLASLHSKRFFANLKAYTGKCISNMAGEKFENII